MELRKYTYKLYPSVTQKEQLLQWLDLHRELYNAAIQERIECYQKTGKSISYNDQQAGLTVTRAEIPEIKAIPVYSTRMTLRRVDKAFKAFFSRVKAGQKPGFPRFKGRARFRSFEMCGGSGWSWHFGEDKKHGRLQIKGIGGVKARGKARILGKAKTSQISFKNGQWYLSLTVETEAVAREDRPTKVCALDWGVETLVSVIEPGGRQTTVDNPRFYRRSAEQIVKLQQSLSNKKRGSNRYRKAHRNLAKARARLQRQRTDRQHKLSARLAKDYALIATEELNIKKMTKSAKGTQEKPGSWVKQKAGLNREILDTAPARLFDMIRYKVEETGGLFVLAPTRALKPSQRCPNCGTVAKKTLSQRVHSCECGCVMPRDMASALVVLNWALESGQELSEAA